MTYSSYLLHVPVQLVIINFIYFFDMNYEIFVKKEFLLLYLLLVYFLSHFSFKFIENPMRKRLRKLVN